MDHYILDGHRAVRCSDFMEWAKWFENGDRRVALTHINESVYVSTVFLGMDHWFGDGPPMLFETMTFGGPHAQDCDRCSTWEEAETQHAAAVGRASYKMSEKLCMFCKHLEFDQTDQYESGGGISCMSCDKGHFYQEVLYGHVDADFRKLILRAETCPDYREVKP